MKNKACCWILVAFGVFVLLGFIGTGILVSTVAMSGTHKVTVKDHSYLLLECTGTIPEYSTAPQFAFLGGSKQTTIADALKALHSAASDSRISGVIIRPTAIGGFAEIRELRNALLEFKKSKKPVYAHLEVATDRDYYLASVADTISLTPTRSGGLAMLGLGIESTYLGKTFEKVGIIFHTLHIGQYKGAYENLSQDSMSVPLRKSLQTLLDDLYQTYTTEIVAARPSLSAATVNDELLNGRKLFLVGQEAKDKGFVDLTLDWQDLKDKLSGDKDLHTVTPSRYNKVASAKTEGSKEIAVLFAEGEINYNSSNDNSLSLDDGITPDAFIKQLRDLRRDDDVAAVVLRVNSPGGSALASDLILREVKRLKEKKPVIVSMGNVAASGGYYISCAGNRIIAQPNTITGSIGVVSLFPTAEGLYKKIAARVETVEKGKWYFYFRPDKGLTEPQKAVLLDYMKGIYDEFVTHVAEGRNMSVDSVAAVAEGRVWTGNQALEYRLVDELGGLDVAIERAKEFGHVQGQTVRVRYYPREKDIVSFIIGQFDMTVRSIREAWLLTPDAREMSRALTYLSHFVQQREFVQAVLPIEIP
ncbi:MAG TPA: signal peptide peptidase SppA [bacterium]|jgi:protease-4